MIRILGKTPVRTAPTETPVPTLAGDRGICYFGQRFFATSVNYRNDVLLELSDIVQAQEVHQEKGRDLIEIAEELSSCETNLFASKNRKTPAKPLSRTGAVNP